VLVIDFSVDVELSEPDGVVQRDAGHMRKRDAVKRLVVAELVELLEELCAVSFRCLARDFNDCFAAITLKRRMSATGRQYHYVIIGCSRSARNLS
jgi:hypothetical protein